MGQGSSRLEKWKRKLEDWRNSSVPVTRPLPLGLPASAPQERAPQVPPAPPQARPAGLATPIPEANPKALLLPVRRSRHQGRPGPGSPDFPGTHGVKVSSDRGRSARTPLQRTETDPSDASARAAPDPPATLRRSRTPDPRPAKVPDAVKNQLQVAGPHGEAAPRARKTDRTRQTRPVPGAGEVAAETTRPAPPPAAARPGAAPAFWSPSVRVMGTRAEPSSSSR